MAIADQTSNNAGVSLAESPPKVTSATKAVKRRSFILPGEYCDAYFVRRSNTLFITFDNLASVGEYEPPKPWLHARTAKFGFSILGIIAKRKDWYRNPTAPELLTSLREAGLFEGFDRIVFTGTSMGAFAAIAFSSIVPGSTVLAFSPQSTLSREIAPFETRYPYGHRKWDWEMPEYLDAANHTRPAAEILVFFDQFIPEDRAHYMRFSGNNLIPVKCGHFGHKLVRTLNACDVLDSVIQDIGNGCFDIQAFRRKLRKRRNVRAWQKALISNLDKSGHPKLALTVCELVAEIDPKFMFPIRARKRIEQEQNSKIAPDSTINTQPKGSNARTAQAPPPLTGAIETLENATVVPERPHDKKLASGVLTSDGDYCESSRTWIRAQKSTPPPGLTADETVDELPGRHLFAGHLRGHFGHFLVESTARLWALGQVAHDVDSVLFLPFRGNSTQSRTALKRYGDFLSQLIGEVPIQIIDRATRVKNLLVPELGFGWNERYAGSEQYRSFMRNRLGRGIAQDGGKKLYISRSQLQAQRGGVLSETAIEETMRDSGYEIFYPEKHSFTEQIARYKATEQVVALDGSALHLAAFLLPPKAKVAIILRRSRANAADYVRQYRSFCQTDPVIIDVVRKDWISGTAKRPDFRSIGELDFQALYDALRKTGFISNNAKCCVPMASEIAKQVADFSNRRGDNFSGLIVPTSSS